MLRFLIKFIVYCGLFALIILLGWIPEIAYGTMVLLCLVLAIFNTFLRPILALLALPIGLITLGFVSIFVNLLTLIITNAIMGHVIVLTFWPLLLLSIGIMIADYFVQTIRTSTKLKYRKSKSAKNKHDHSIIYTIL